MTRYRELKERAWKANMELPRQGLVLYTFGNVSAFDPGSGVFAIKPSGVAYDRLTARDMVVCDLENRTVEGRLRPSSDTRTHAVLYRTFRGIRGVAHTHSAYATAWAQAQKEIPVLGTTHADHMPCGVPCTALMSDELIRGDYEEATGLQITERFRNLSPDKIEMVLVAGHGPFTWGGSADRAVYNSVVLEELARMAFLSLQINPDVPFLKETLIRKHYERKHGQNAYYGQQESGNKNS